MGRRSINYIKTNDGSNTLYSTQYDQNFHSIGDGALNEAYLKYINPSFEIFKDKDTLNILDICFGIGYNTFATILYILDNNLKTKVNFFSPEFDLELISSLKEFEYPKEFNKIKHIIKAISTNHFYQDEQFKIELYIGDAREYIKTLSNVDIVYQDPFSSDVNHELWTTQYFKDIVNTLSDKAIVLTYSIATPIRIGMYENGLNIQEYKYDQKRRATLGSNFYLDNNSYNLKLIDMEKKKINSPYSKSLQDTF
ncbi:MAG: hypothetical protein KAJ49_00845 [Arcobacteraceae bacterium]|nr:hypothetical protein [Arcobacteraceae bacterium]